jgi:hypothetical protein
VTNLIVTGAVGDTRSAGGRRASLLRRAAPLTSAELISDGVRPELLAALALRRTAGGGIDKWDDHYFDSGRPTPSWLAGVFEELIGTGLLALAEQEHPGLRRMRRMSLTSAGLLRYEQLRDLLRRPARQDPGLAVKRSLLREVIVLAGEAPGLSDEVLRARVLRLAQHARSWPPVQEVGLTSVDSVDGPSVTS